MSSRSVLAGAALLVLATTAAYAPSLGGGFILDDNVLVTDSALIRASDGLYRFWLTSEPIDYWPVTNSSFWLEWRLWGMNPVGYHVTNLVLHVASSLLLWALLARLAVPGAFLGALLFALHPVNVESVAWITQRKNLLAMLFGMLSLLAYLESEERARSRRPGASAYAIALAAFALAMLSKASVVVLPVALLGILRWMRPLTARDVLRATPFFLIGLALTLVNIAFQSRFTNAGVRSAAPVERLLGAAGTVWFYLSKALLPLDLCFVYPKWDVRADRLEWWLPLAAAVALTAVLWLRRRSWGGAPLFAWGIFALALAPVMGFTDVGFMEHSLVADHYQHLALIAVVALAGAAWAKWREHLGTNRRAADAVAVAAVIALGFLTWRQSALYADAVTLFDATVRETPDSAFAQNNLGLALLAEGRTAEARARFERAVALTPDYFEAHYNRARTLLRMNEIEPAIASYREAVRLQPHYPVYRYDLAQALAGAGRPAEAVEQFREILRLVPPNPESENNLGAALFEAGRAAEAIEHYERALALDPEFAPAHANLGRALYAARRLPEAVEHLERAVRRTPDSPDAHNLLAVVLAESGRLDEAITHLRRAIEIAPDDVQARNNLAEALAMRAASERSDPPR